MGKSFSTETRDASGERSALHMVAGDSRTIEEAAKWLAPLQVGEAPWEKDLFLCGMPINEQLNFIRRCAKWSKCPL